FFVCGDARAFTADERPWIKHFVIANLSSPDTSQLPPEIAETALPIYEVPLETDVVPGIPDPANAPATIAALEAAAQSCLSGLASALITAPIQKATLAAAGFKYPGHTEYLAAKTGASDHLMLLAGGGLRVALVTIHVPLKDVPALI